MKISKKPKWVDWSSSVGLAGGSMLAARCAGRERPDQPGRRRCRRVGPSSPRPVVDEVKIGEIAVKRGVQEAKAELKEQIPSVRTEVETSLQSSGHFTGIHWATTSKSGATRYPS